MCKSDNMQSNEAEVIGTVEAAATLNVDRTTLVRWISRGKVKPFVRGTGRTGEYMFLRSDIENVKRSQRHHDGSRP